MKLKLIMLVMCVVTLSACAESYEYKDVSGVVVDKEHDRAGYTTKRVLNSDGDYVKKKVYNAEEFEITIQYADITREFEFKDSRLFNQVEVGDNIPLVLTSGIDANGNVVSTQIDLKD